MFDEITVKFKKIIVGYPKCVDDEPFTLVHSPAEERDWLSKNKDHVAAKEKEKAKQAELQKEQEAQAKQKLRDELKAEIMAEMDAAKPKKKTA